jgi:hypothetical protein
MARTTATVARYSRNPSFRHTITIGSIASGGGGSRGHVPNSRGTLAVPGVDSTDATTLPLCMSEQAAPGGSVRSTSSWVRPLISGSDAFGGAVPQDTSDAAITTPKTARFMALAPFSLSLSRCGAHRVDLSQQATQKSRAEIGNEAKAIVRRCDCRFLSRGATYLAADARPQPWKV